PDFPLADFIAARGYAASEDFQAYNPAYLEKLNELYTEENLEHMKNYMTVKVALNFLDSLDQEAYDIYVQMRTAITGATRQDDETAAYEAVKSLLLEPLEQVYLEKYGSEKMKSDTTELCENVISYYRTMLEKEDWLSEETKQMAIKKLENISIHAAYPEKWYDYSGLDISEDSFYEATLKIALTELERDIKYVNQKVDPDEWGVDILVCNAFYNPMNNSINIMLGILGGAFYDENMSDEEMYGAIGVVIGHEISHAFDTTGAQFDEKGNLANWWTEEDLQIFHERAGKLAAYYDQIVPYTGETVKGSNIQTEAIADMAGVKAMLSILSEKEDVDYDLFFRTYAGIWRMNNAPEREETNLTQDSHPLGYLRTNVTVQQFDEFIETYDIKEGDNMYLAPEDRILVW
ncbi:MAG: M13 family metallopeptidase, partial [Clostridia bacterium]|nr:M13 family metallopeptidase [Clostridia bacterium]